MDFRILSSFGINSINKSKFQPLKGHNVTFVGQNADDRVEINSGGKYLSESSIRQMIQNNPKIQEIIGDVNPNLELNLDGLAKIQRGHSSDMKRISSQIIDNLPQSMQSNINKEAIFEAATLHDIGKVLIPSEILNKPGKLTNQEHVIMEKHSTLGYELLKNTNVDEYVKKLVKYHHQNANLTGYPKIDDGFEPDINLQILSLADTYSALTEKRPYKEALSPKQALTIIYHQKIKSGEIHPFIFNALIKSVNQVPAFSNIN